MGKSRVSCSSLTFPRPSAPEAPCQGLGAEAPFAHRQHHVRQLLGLFTFFFPWEKEVQRADEMGNLWWFFFLGFWMMLEGIFFGIILGMNEDFMLFFTEISANNCGFWVFNPNSITTETCLMMLHLGPIPFFIQRTSRAHAQTTHPKNILQLRFISPKITMTYFTSNVTCGLSQFITILGWKKMVIWLSNNVFIQTFHQKISKNSQKPSNSFYLPEIFHRFLIDFPGFS